MARVNLDVTTSWGSGFLTSKFTRIEHALATEVDEDCVRLVRFDNKRKTFVEEPQIPGRRPDINQTNLFRRILANIKSITWAGWLAIRFILAGAAPGVSSKLPALLHEYALAMPYLTLRQIRLIARAADLLGHRNRAADLTIEICRSYTDASSPREPNSEAIFERGEWLVLAGASWRHIDFDVINHLKSRGVSIAMMIYDLIPINNPSLVSARQRRQYMDFLSNVAAVSDTILTPSRRTAQELSTFFTHHELQHTRVRVLPMRCGLSSSGPITPTKRLQALALDRRPFAIQVAPIMRRRNQLFAYGLWKELRRRLGDRTPALVFVGSLVAPELLERMTRDQEWNDIAVYLPDADDAELAWLYKNAKFSIAPSISIGLGMSVWESINFGCPCVCASLPDSAGANELISQVGFCEAGWLGVIERLTMAPTRVPSNEELQPAHSTWPDFAQALLSALREIEGAPCPHAGQ